MKHELLTSLDQRSFVPTVSSLAVFGVALFYQAGCSLIGFGLGSLIDSENAHQVWAARSGMLELTPGDSTSVVLEGASRFEGTIRSLPPLPGNLYGEQYTDFLSASDLPLPGLGDTLLVQMLPGKAAESRQVGVFTGFDTYTSLKLRQGKETRSIALENVKTVTDKYGNQLAGSDAQDLLASYRVPLDRGILLQTDTGDTLLPFSLIDSIKVNEEGNWKMVGLAVGAGIDVAVILVAAGGNSGKGQPQPSSSRSSPSCGGGL